MRNEFIIPIFSGIFNQKIVLYGEGANAEENYQVIRYLFYHFLLFSPPPNPKWRDLEPLKGGWLRKTVL